MILGLKRAWKAVSLGWKILGVASLVLGAVSLFYFFTWRISITPGATLKNSDPFATMFILQNDGQFSIYDIEFSCVLNDVKYGNNVELSKILSHIGTFNVPILDANAKTSTPCYLSFGTSHPAMRADVTLFVSYRPSFYPFRRTKSFRYFATLKDDNTYAWIPMAE